ncbi:hypothetical protein A2U01_0055025, partial [Trifolium medium]|nr:hypothetical protein [Trifolium medium]
KQPPPTIFSPRVISERFERSDIVARVRSERVISERVERCDIGVFTKRFDEAVAGGGSDLTSSPYIFAAHYFHSERYVC